MNRYFAAGLVATSIGLAALTSPALAAPVGPDDVAFDEGSVAKSLTGKAGDAKSGREIFMARKLGNCLACHENPDMTDQPFHGDVGPSLEGVAERYDQAQLRGLVVNAKNSFEGTIMPSFYRLENGALPLGKFAGKTILSAQEVEDLVAYLMTLK